MKRFALLLLAISFALALCACGVQPVEETEPTLDVTEAPTKAPVHTETIPEGLIDDEEYRALTSYFVTVLDEAARPVVGAVVQLNGSETTCVTDETGVAQFAVQEGEYAVSIQELPMGYEFATDSREFPFETDDVTLVIQVRQTFSEPDDLGMEEDNLPIEETPVEEFVPEG